MTYTVKEIFYTLQGEGAQSGRAAVFCRFSGCNLWSGRRCDQQSKSRRAADDPAHSEVGRFPERSEFPASGVGGLPDRSAGVPRKYVVCTGGEPLLQVDEKLISELHQRGFEVAVETNGTRPAPKSLDWICVSPKAGAPLVQKSGNELKLVYPQENAQPEEFERLDFRHFFLQPMDGPDVAANTERAIEYCLRHPRWRLSLQTHKLVGLR
jgi:7-carboxy-7-deazaguanine synthase (Cx14CxxC type)